MHSKSGNQSKGYYYTYNKKNQIIEVNVGYSKDTSILKYRYHYDSYGRVTKILNPRNIILKEYKYDISGRIIKSKSINHESDISYDYEGNVSLINNTISGISSNQVYIDKSRGNGLNPTSINDVLSSISYVRIATFTNDLCVRDKYISLECFTCKGDVSEATISYDGIVPQVELQSRAKCALVYKIPEEKIVISSGALAFWFKPTDIYSIQYLFTQKNKGKDSYISAYIYNGIVFFNIHNRSYQIELRSNTNLRQNEWNFFALNYICRNDTGLPDDFILEISFMLNGEIKKHKEYNEYYSYSSDNTLEYHIAHSYIDEVFGSSLKGKLAFLMIGNNRYISDVDILKYYEYTKDYIINNTIDGVNHSIASVVPTNANLNSFEIYPLMNDIKSVKNKYPLSYTIRRINEYDKDRTFRYDSKAKRYSYIADGNILIYSLNTSLSKTIIMNCFTHVSLNIAYLFELSDGVNSLSLYRNKDKHLCLNYNGLDYITDLTFSTNAWHRLGFSYTIIGNNTLLYVINLDGTVYDGVWTLNNTFRPNKMMLGRSFSTERIVSEMGTYQTSFELKGLINMLAISDSFNDSLSLNDLFNSLDPTSELTHFDELDRVSSREVLNRGSILSNQYVYDKARAIGEVIANNTSILTTRSYTYDKLGRVTSITDNAFGAKSYTYNSYGYLISDSINSCQYDLNGNIIKFNNTSFTYDSVIKDKLLSIGGRPILYDDLNPLLISSFDDLELTYNEYRLVETYKSLGGGAEQLYFER